MTLAERIRLYVLKHYVEPARKARRATITIRAGDIHKAMNLDDRMPAVCDAICTDIFPDMADLKLIRRSGPKHGANVEFTYTVLYLS